MPIQKITPFLWFDHQAEEAARFYTSVFPNSKIDGITYYGEHGPGPKGTVMTVGFELDGQKFTALNGGPVFKFNEAISFVVHCETPEELDTLWAKLTAGGQEVQCGWLKDKYGLSWQVVPQRFIQLMTEGDPAGKARMMQAMMTMKKLDAVALEAAYRSANPS
jgi:predicted 3-demethylubiquinone-9 3-methyltransferase (glyoxalase superfamily)